ncbi:MAG: hypothetical protein Q8R30_00500 [bacterium]|nr:hypothetical protein [bacterium]MDZ4285644.1 hypothetical protein [Candidatus Sungbacteria bacterium]
MIQRNLSANQTLTAEVRDRNNLLFQGHVEAVSSYNDKGLFDVLPQHANFISLIKKLIIIHISKTEEKKFEIESGMLKVRDNNIEIYLGILRQK